MKVGKKIKINLLHFFFGNKNNNDDDDDGNNVGMNKQWSLM